MSNTKRETEEFPMPSQEDYWRKRALEAEEAAGRATRDFANAVKIIAYMTDRMEAKDLEFHTLEGKELALREKLGKAEELLAKACQVCDLADDKCFSSNVVCNIKTVRETLKL